MRAAQDIVTKILLTEKISRHMEKNNQYGFQVDRDANKVEIKRAVQQLFNVHVVKVNTMNRRGKVKRGRTRAGTTVATKRALVTLKTGEKIDVV